MNVNRLEQRLDGPERLPPHNRDAERALLGAMLRDPQTIREATRMVRAEDYYLFAHVKIHELIVDLHGRGIPVDTVTLGDAVIGRDLVEDIGGLAYLAGLWDAAPSSGSVRYCQIVAQYAKRRRAAAVAASLQMQAYDLSASPDEILDAAIERITEIRSGSCDLHDIENLSLPETGWPTLGDAAYYGIVGDIVVQLEPETEADPAGLLIQLLIASGNAIGRTAYARVEGDRHYTNLFGTGVGRSGHGRKGTAWGRTREFMVGADPNWVDKCTGSGMSSGEGLIQRVRDSVLIENGDTQTLISGVSDKRLLAIETEFGSVLKVLKRDGNTLSAILRNAWDSGCISTLTKSPLIASNAHISIIGHITIEELRKCFDEVDVFNGFANRFLWFLVKRSKFLPDGGRKLDLGSLTQRFREVIDFARRLEGLDRADSMRELWHDLYPVLSGGRPGLAGIVTSRAESQVLRLATLYAALDCSSIIMLAHLQAAHAVWCYCEESARLIFGCEHRLDRLSESILEHLQAAGARGMTRSQIRYAMGRHILSKPILDSLAKLREAGKARCDKAKSDQEIGGRPSEQWFAI